MTRRRRALSCLLSAIAMAPVGAAADGVWVMTPLAGILGDYSSNPALLYGVRATGVTTGALQLDAPTVYQGDAFQFSVFPSVRQANTSGYSAVTSDYEHLNLGGAYTSERGTLTANGGATRDSSLAYDSLTSGTQGVRRDSLSADANWDQHLSERLEYQLDANTQRVNFGHSPGVSRLALVDYEYSNVAPGLAWNSSERNKFSLSGAVSRYNSIDFHDAFGGRYYTESRSTSLQLGFVHQLSELWTLTALGGYSRVLNEIDVNEYNIDITPTSLTVQIIPRRGATSQNGSVYAATLTHKGTLLTLTAQASRQLAPSGFAYLSRQDIYELTTAYTPSDRWTLSADARLVRYQNPPGYQTQLNQVQAANVYTRYFSAAASWHWTEHWTVRLSASRVSETIQYNPYNAASNEVTLSITRQFDPITL